MKRAFLKVFFFLLKLFGRLFHSRKRDKKDESVHVEADFKSEIHK